MVFRPYVRAKMGHLIGRYVQIAFDLGSGVLMGPS
jgi:hypothetical protein